MRRDGGRLANCGGGILLAFRLFQGKPCFMLGKLITLLPRLWDNSSLVSLLINATPWQSNPLVGSS